MKNSHDQHDHPSLWESRQDTQRRYQIRAYHWKKVQEKEEDCQHSCIRNMQSASTTPVHRALLPAQAETCPENTHPGSDQVSVTGK